MLEKKDQAANRLKHFFASNRKIQLQKASLLRMIFGRVRARV
jgi:hypothetical protein